MAADPLFLDTAGWVALLNSRDSLHEMAAKHWTELVRDARPVVITDLIVAETGNALAPTPARTAFVPSLRLLQRSPRVRIVHTTPDLLEQATVLYESRHDKQWGLVDCLSFTVMEHRGIADAFTSDHHFSQAGFTPLLK